MAISKRVSERQDLTSLEAFAEIHGVQGEIQVSCLSLSLQVFKESAYQIRGIASTLVLEDRGFG